MIFITGATGHVGTEITKQLIERGQPLRILVRDPAKARALHGAVTMATGDLADPSSLERAMRGADRLLLLTAGLDMAKYEENAVQAAHATGVSHIVKVSVAGAETDTFDIGRIHHRSEQRIARLGISCTVLRPVNFMSNALEWVPTIRSDGAIYLPTGVGRAAFIDPADVAAVAVEALLSPDAHRGKAYVLTGPELLSTADLAATIGRVIGKQVKHVDIAPETARQSLLALRMPESMVTALLELFAAVRAGQLELRTDTVADLLGRKPTSFESWVRRNGAAFGASQEEE